MFKNIYKVSSYGDELRVDFGLNKRPRNYRFKNKVLYIKDKLIFRKNKNRLYYKYKYVVNYRYYLSDKLENNNILHRNFDKPAVIHLSGIKLWFYHGKLHRENDLPAIICRYGTKYWYKNGVRHRENDLPAFISRYGIKEWYKNGVQYTP